MANIKSAKKRAVRSEVLRRHNGNLRSSFRTTIKRVLAAIDRKDKEAGKALMVVAIKTLDKAASKKLLHKNTAARYKHNLNQRLKVLSD